MDGRISVKILQQMYNIQKIDRVTKTVV